MTNLQTTKVLQRARGVADLAFDKQRIARMYQAGSSKILLPKTYTPLKEAVLINTAGGILKLQRGFTIALALPPKLTFISPSMKYRPFIGSRKKPLFLMVL